MKLNNVSHVLALFKTSSLSKSMLHLRMDPTGHIAQIPVKRLRVTEILLVLILKHGQLCTLFQYTRKSIYAGYYCYQILQFQQTEYDLPNGI